MRLYLDATWEEFVSDVQNSCQGITLFGASSCGKMFMEQVNLKFLIKRIIDNDEKKLGQCSDFENVSIEGINSLKEDNEDSILLITSTWYLEIIQQLKDFGYQGKVYSFLNLRKVLAGYSESNSIRQFEEHIDHLKALLADNESKIIADAILDKRIQQNLDYSDICTGHEYFIPDIISVRNDAVYVDGGAYNGDSVKNFIDFQKNCFKKIYAFEPDLKNFNNIDCKDLDERIEFYNYGLWSKKDELSFMSSDTGSTISEMGNKTIKVISLDTFLCEQKVTLIKMDIEGAETEALRGAENIIKKWQPDLAICIYHKPEDVWTIPLMLHSMVKDYKFYIRHHGSTIMDTVLYATTK